MKWLSRVVWSEGMYLAPHHFQIQGRYFEDSIRFAIEHAWFAPWGFSKCKLDRNVIRKGRVTLLKGDGIFEDGLSFSVDKMDKDSDLIPDRDVSLPPDKHEMVVLLAVPKRQDNVRNCDLDENRDENRNHCRYYAKARSIRDLNNGSDEKEVKIGRKSIAIVTEPEVDDSMNTIPLARIRRQGDGTLVYDPGFIPPCTKITASAWLMELLDELIELLDDKRTVLANRRRGEVGFEVGLSQMEVSNFWFLHAINDGLVQLRHCKSKESHPEELFRELSRLAGALCTFNLESDPNKLPTYNHRQPAVCFSDLDAHIREHLNIYIPDNAVPVPLKLTSPNTYKSAEIEDQRCFGQSRWVLGLGSSAGESAVITKASSLVKICSAPFVEGLVRHATPGLSLIYLHIPPPAISPRAGLRYFTISQSGRCWDHILQTRTIGIYVPDELPEPEIDLQVVLES